MTELISRAEAQARGLTRYFTGKLCAYQHISERFTGSRKCVKCSQEWRDNNLLSARKSAARWQKANPETRRAHKLKSRYGVTPKQVEETLLKQNNCCAICERPIEGKNAHIDHDHTTMEFRGMLCFSCNSGLGQFQDDVSRLEKAIAYLKKD